MGHVCSSRALSTLLLLLLLALECRRTDGVDQWGRSSAILQSDGTLEHVDTGLVVSTSAVDMDGNVVVSEEHGQLMVPADDLFSRGYEAQQRGDSEKAISDYRAALKAGLCTPSLYNNLALALKHSAKGEEAKEVFEQGIELFPGSELLETNRAVIFKPPRLRPEKVEGVENATSMKHAGELMFKQALKYHKAGKKAEALELYIQAEVANNMIPDLHNNLALLYSDMNWVTKACETWEKGHRLWPGNELLNANRGIIFAGPDGSCGKREVLTLAGSAPGPPGARALPTTPRSEL